VLGWDVLCVLRMASVAGYVGRRTQTVDTVQHKLDATNVPISRSEVP
jgi:hypothetical protein